MNGSMVESNGTQTQVGNGTHPVVRVLIADDHPIVLRGLRNLLSSYSDLCVVGEAETGMDAIALGAELKPDILVLDLRMPGVNGIEVVWQLRRLAPGVRVVVLSSYDDQEYVVQALEAGAYAYVLKTTADIQLVDSIRRVYAGERLLTPSLIDGVLQHLSELGGGNSARRHGLTDEELRVLSAVAEGLGNKDIAALLNWSEITIKRMLQHIMNKLGAANRAQAVVEAYRRGLIY